MASPYAALSGSRLARASDSQLYDFALSYARAHGLTPTGVAGAGTAAAPHRYVNAAGQDVALAQVIDPATGHTRIPTGVTELPGTAPAFATPARLELGRQSNPNDALARRRILAASLARRTTEASRQRALARIGAGYGWTV